MPFGYLGEHGPRSNFNYRRAQKVFRWQAAFVGQLEEKWAKVGGQWTDESGTDIEGHRRSKSWNATEKRFRGFWKYWQRQPLQKTRSLPTVVSNCLLRLKSNSRRCFKAVNEKAFCLENYALSSKTSVHLDICLFFWYWIYFCQIYMKGHFFRDTHWYSCFILKVWFG